ncbi:hypothetical protein ACFUC1_07110 [Pedococcus sp. NPDC057267]|uniref:hypothetical protein n=1 Tax=Pedococcus sp. NPDC057267 TaxID=3346077 RepID=UPI0036445124
MATPRWRLWVARVAVVVALVAVWVVLSRLWSYATADDPAVIGSSDVVAVASAACAQMREAAAAAAVGPAATVRQRVGAVNAQDDAVTTLVARVRTLGEARLSADAPAQQWLQDWERLVAAREAYARDLAAGKRAVLTLPVVDGRPLLDRLNNVGLNCRVPRVLLTP